MTTSDDCKVLFGYMLLNKLGLDAVHHIERDISKLDLWEERGYKAIPMYLDLQDIYDNNMIVREGIPWRGS